MIKILHLKKYLGTVNGITKYISILQQNSSDAFEHYVMSTNFDSFDERYLNRNVYKLRSLFNSNLDIFFISIQVYRFCKKHNINIIHSHHRYYELISFIVAKLLNLKTITTVHYYSNNNKLLSYLSQRIITVNNRLTIRLKEEFNVPSDKIICIKNCLYDNKENLNLNESNTNSLSFPTIGYLGRIDYPEKGLDILLNAFRLLKEQQIKFKGIIKGNGPDYNKVKNFIQAYNLNVELWSPREDNSSFFNLIDIFVLPSRIDPFPFTMLEAADHMIPFIGSRVDGISEYVDDQVSGLLFEKENFEELSQKIMILIKNGFLRQELAIKNKQKLIEQYSISEFIKKIENEYHLLMGK